MSETVGIMFVMTVIVGGLVWLIRTFFNNLYHKRELAVMAKFHDKLFDKLNDPSDVRALLESSASERLFQSLSRERSPNVHRKVLFGLQAGIVLAMAGLAFLVLGWMYHFDDDGFTILGVLALATGMGFLLSSALSYYLSQKWNLLAKDAERREITEHGDLGGV